MTQSARNTIGPGRWQQIQDVLGAAIDCNTTDRGRLLDERCAGDDELRHEVETLLAAHDSVGLIDKLADAVAPAASWARAQTVGWEGRRVGPYSVRELLGAGGMGLVYRARDERLGRHVALKFLSPDLSSQRTAKGRFLVEARAAAALDHPNVCTIHEIGEAEGGHPFIAMPLYDGETLQARLLRGPLAFDAAVSIARQVARGLACAHDRRVVHRDIKPSNVMLLTDGTVKILDFGIAKMDDVSLTGHGVPLGTIAYMSPEQVRGDAVDHRSDIWSLGVMVYEMLTGARPFTGADRQQVAAAILAEAPEPVAGNRSDVPAGVDDVIRRALAKRVDERYASMAPFGADLATLASDTGGPLNVGSPGLSGPAPPTQATPASERRRAAVLVTIVSDYAALIEHLAPVDAHRLVAEIRDAAVDVVRRHGGLVNQAIGEEIVSLFGVPTAHEDDELRAVRAALELHARIQQRTPEAGTAPAVRIQSGLHVGSVVSQRLWDGPRRYAIVGAPSQSAARLAALAAPGDVVLSPECQRLVAPFVHSLPCPPVVLEPDGSAVTPFRVTGETGLETRLEASERSGLTPYVGRQSELALLETHVNRARDGEGRLLTIVGEAGVGKSRLLHEFRERAAASGEVRLLNGRCRDISNVAPYFPFVEVLRDALCLRNAVVTDAHDIVARLRAIEASLEPFLPLYLHLLSVPSDSYPLPRHLQGEHLRAVLLDALAAVISALAHQHTLVVLLEDWHWADAASRAALSRMTDIVAAHRLLFVVTTRPGRGGEHESPAQGTRIQLEPLDFTASAAIMQAVLRAEKISEELARRVFERTSGNPFFLEQMCCSLLERGAVAARDGEAVVGTGAALSLPDTVQAVIRARLDNLDPHAREVLRVASVIGREFEYAILADALVPETDLRTALVRLNASGLIQQVSVVPEVSYRFKHVLTQEVSYESLVARQRTSLHGVIGRAIERRYAERLDEKSALLAHHFERAGAWTDAVLYGRRAAARAGALSQFADALAMLDRVLAWLEQLPDDEGRRDLKADLLLQQERECETLGLRSRQREIVADLIAHLAPRGPSGRLAEAYLRQGDVFTLLKRFDAADRALSTALRISRERGDAALERNTLRSLGLLRWHEGRYQEALAITEDTLAIDRECQDDLAVAGDLTNLGSILKSMGDEVGAQARLEQALAMPMLAQDPRKLSHALHKLGNVHCAIGNLTPGLEYLRRADDVARTHLLPIQRSFHLTSIAHIHLRQGNIDAAIHTYRQAIELSRRARHAEGLTQSLRTLGEVLFGLARYQDALPYLQEASQLFTQLEDPSAEAAMWNRIAVAFERTGRPAEALEAWRAAYALCQRLKDTGGQLEALEGTARALRAQHASPDIVLQAFEAALDLASTLGEDRHALSLRNTLGILEWTRGRYADALQHYEAALLLARGLSAPVEEGLILNSLGVMLTKLGRTDEARTALEQGVSLGRETGELNLEAQALGALGQMSRRIGDVPRAVDYYNRSLELRRVLGDRTGEGWMLCRIAEARRDLGETPAAQDALEAAERIATDTGDVALLAACRDACH